MNFLAWAVSPYISVFVGLQNYDNFATNKNYEHNIGCIDQ
jgi:hypothetical protein